MYYSGCFMDFETASTCTDVGSVPVILGCAYCNDSRGKGERKLANPYFGFNTVRRLGGGGGGGDVPLAGLRWQQLETITQLMLYTLSVTAWHVPVDINDNISSFTCCVVIPRVLVVVLLIMLLCWVIHVIHHFHQVLVNKVGIYVPGVTNCLAEYHS